MQSKAAEPSAFSWRFHSHASTGGTDNTNYAQLAQQQQQRPATVQPATAQRQQTNSYHKVKRGETLYAIARQHGTTVDALCRLNRITLRTVLRPGQILKYN